MTGRPIDTDLVRRLEGTPGLDARLAASLAPHTTFRIGGPAGCLVRVLEKSALAPLLAAVGAAGEAFFLLGLGSNVLIPDDGLPGVVGRLAGEFSEIEVFGNQVRVGGAVTLAKVAKQTAARGLSGLEALAGFPSTIGGAVYMNAGSYGTEIKDVLVAATVADADGRTREVTPEDLKPAYRRTNLQGTGSIVIDATFELVAGDPDRSLARIEELNRRRWSSLPSGVPHAGSIFRNPEDDFAGRLIERCGFKGLPCGGAQVSTEHANVIVNRGGALAADVLELMLRAAEAVRRRFDVVLDPEIVLAGDLRRRWLSGRPAAAD